MKVKCINQGNFKNITLGSEYEVSDQTEGLYYVINNIGDTAKYSKNYFEVVEEIKEIIVPVAVKKETSIRFEKDYDDGNEVESFQCYINNQYVTTFSLYKGVAGNCGLIAVNGIEYLMRNLISYKTKDLFDESIEDIFKTIINKLLTIISKNSWGLVLFSTNTNTEILITLMDEMADSSTQVFKNPNSGNNCKMWHFFINQ